MATIFHVIKLSVVLFGCFITTESNCCVDSNAHPWSMFSSNDTGMWNQKVRRIHRDMNHTSNSIKKLDDNFAYLFPVWSNMTGYISQKYGEPCCRVIQGVVRDHEYDAQHLGRLEKYINSVRQKLDFQKEGWIEKFSRAGQSFFLVEQYCSLYPARKQLECEFKDMKRDKEQIIHDIRNMYYFLSSSNMPQDSDFLKTIFKGGLYELDIFLRPSS